VISFVLSSSFMRAEWLSYIRNNYPEGDGGVIAGPAFGQGALVVPDDE
jgi:hypothetical protein